MDARPAAPDDWLAGGSAGPDGSGSFVRRGLWFEELAAGQCFESPGRTITEADLVLFTGLSGDATALHTDEEYARHTPFRRRIAHGMLVQAVATGLASRTGIFEGTIVALPAMRIRWQNPAFPGDTLRLRLRVTGKDPEPSRRSGRVYFEAAVLNQKDQVVTEGEWELLMLRDRARGSGPPEDASPR